MCNKDSNFNTQDIPFNPPKEICKPRCILGHPFNLIGTIALTFSFVALALVLHCNMEHEFYKWILCFVLIITIPTCVALLFLYNKQMFAEKSKRQEHYDHEYYKWVGEQQDKDIENLLIEKWFRSLIEEDVKENEHQRRVEIKLMENKFAIEQEQLRLQHDRDNNNDMHDIMKRMINLVSNQ